MNQHRKENELLFGRIALRLGLITEDALRDCLRVQEEEETHGSPPRSLGTILIERRHIDRTTLENLVSEQRRILAIISEFAPRKKEDILFGRILLKQELIMEDDLHRCLRIQQDMLEKGILMRLGEILVKKGLLTPHQVREVLKVQLKSLMTCPSCGRNYNIARYQPGKTYTCPSCRHELLPSKGPSVEATEAAEEESIPAAATPPRATKEEMPRAAARPAPPAPTSTPRMGRYEILQEIGRGGFGVVYRAFDPALKKVVALKTLHPDIQEDDMVRRFLKEAQTGGKLRHPNIVPVHDAGEEGGIKYFTMEFVEGTTLEKELDKHRKSGKPIPLRTALRFLLEASKGLAHMHKVGIIHRDVKPGNILIDTAISAAMVTDFGLAKEMDEATRLTMTGTTIGTPAYMSPEQASGRREELGPWSDVFSLGAVLYNILVGSTPFEGKTQADILVKVISDEVKPPSELARRHRATGCWRRRIPKDLESICMKALEKETARRYPDAGEFALDLERFLEEEPISARPVSGLARRWRRLKGNRPALVAASAAAVLILGAIAYFAVTMVISSIELERLRREMQEAYDTGDWSKALGPAERILHVSPDDETASRIRSECQAKLQEIEGQKREAEEEKEKAKKALEAQKESLGLLENAKGELYRAEMLFFSDEYTYSELVRIVEKAIGFIDAAEEKAPDLAMVHFARGKACRLLGKDEQAIESFEKAVKLEPDLLVAYLHLGIALCEDAIVSRLSAGGTSQRRGELFREKIRKAREAFEKGLKGTPTPDSEFEFNLAEVMEKTARSETFPELMELCESYFRKHRGNPESVRFLCVEGVTLYLEGSFEEAIKELGRAIDFRPNTLWALFFRGACRIELGDYQGATQDFTKAVEINPECAAVYVERGSAFCKQGDTNRGIEDFTRALDLNPELAIAYYNRGTALLRLGDLDGALEDFTRVIEIDPQYNEAYDNRGGVRYKKRDFEGAIADYTKAIEIDSKDATAYNNRGVVRRARGDIRGAIDDYSKAIEINPEYAEAYWNRGNTRFGQRDFSGAIEDFTKVIENAPPSADSFNSRGAAWHASGDIDNALADFAKAIELDPHYAKAYRNRGIARHSADDLDGAIADASKAIELDPEYANAYLDRGMWRREKGDIKGAIKDLEKALEVAPPNWPGRSEARDVLESLSGDRE